MISSLFTLRLKIIMGYITLVILFIILLVLTYRENKRLSVIDKYSKTALAQQEQAEVITLQLLDIAMFGEQMIVWDEKDVITYKRKQDKIVNSLKRLQNQQQEGPLRCQITSILALLSTKEVQTLSIVNDLKDVNLSDELFKERIPDIIWQTKKDRQLLTNQIEDNYRKSEKESRGLLGFLRNKRKIRHQVKQKNEVILLRQARSNILLRSLATEMRRTHEEKRKQLFTHMDSLNRQSASLNYKINRLITEFSHTAQTHAKEKTEIYLLGQKKSLRLVSAMGIGAALLSIVFYLILHRDLKGRYQHRVQLEKLNIKNEDLLLSRKNMMLTVSHDLRIPLASIRGCAELIVDERYKEKRALLCETILQSSDSMTNLLNALLSFHRLDTGKELPSYTPFRLRRLLETLNSEFLPVAYKAGLQFNVEYDEGDVVVAGDQERLTQIARNLISNAIKFTTEGKVQLKLRHMEEILTIEVSDTGTGMTHEQTERIFQPFERLENAETRDGFGLGLAITQGLVGLLNGAIEIDSKPGKGSTFTVRIPLPIAEEQHLKKTPVPYYNLPSGLKILAIDDDAVLLKMTEDILTRNRVRCDTCQEVQELTARMREQKYDLLITDIRMPKISGFDLLELLRSSNIGSSRTIPVLALTAQADCQESDFIAQGFAGSLYKPFSITELLLAIQRCIGKSKDDNPLQADFTELLSGEQNNKGMLELLIRETEKDMNALEESMEKEDRHSMLELLHHLLPLWEIVRVNSSLDDLCRILAENTEMTDKEVHLGVNKVIETGRQLTLQASTKIKKDGYV